MRPRRLAVVARRDLVSELRGRRGWLLPATMAGLLLPVSTLPIPEIGSDDADELWVAGDVPEQVSALDGVRRRPRGADLRFRRDHDDVLLVDGGPLREDVRAALDGPKPTIRVQQRSNPVPTPTRSMLFALISASTLSGAVSASIAGERSQHTLVALLSAAITRVEVVGGKWLAWGGLGALSAMIAAAVAIALGYLQPGTWLLPLPTVPLGTVALGLFLVRRATDVISGTTVSLRVMPAALAITGVVAWLAGMSHPLYGAAVPLGGALLAAGNTWGEDPTVALVATLSTMALSFACLRQTARDLEESPSEPIDDGGARLVATAFGVTAVAWWVPVIGPLLWTSAGNPRITDEMPMAAGVVAGGLGLLLLAVVHAGRAESVTRALGLWWPQGRAWRQAVFAGLILWLVAAIPSLVGMPDDPLVAQARTRLTAAFHPVFAGPVPLVLCIVADELVFRGWLQQRLGGARATVIYATIKAPLDPVNALLVGAGLSWLTARAGGTIVPALAARAIWATLSLT